MCKVMEDIATYTELTMEEIKRQFQTGKMLYNIEESYMTARSDPMKRDKLENSKITETTYYLKEIKFPVCEEKMKPKKE